MTGGFPERGRGGKARRWALVLAAAFLAGLAVVGLALLAPQDDGKEDAPASNAFSPAPQPAAQTPPPQAAPRPAAPRLFIVVDDLGYNPSGDAAWLEFPGTITAAVIPFGPSSRKVAASAKARGFGVLIHVPMEPDQPAGDRTESFRLRVGMGADEVEAAFARMAEDIPEAAGASNHMGSAFTADAGSMSRFAQVLAKRGFFFIDSVTTARSAAVDAARGAGVRAIRRDVFLDAGPDPGAMRAQWDAATSLALSKGTAVLLCHARPETLKALQEFLPDLRRLGIETAAIKDHPGLGDR